MSCGEFRWVILRQLRLSGVSLCWLLYGNVGQLRFFVVLYDMVSWVLVTQLSRVEASFFYGQLDCGMAVKV